MSVFNDEYFNDLEETCLALKEKYADVLSTSKEVLEKVDELYEIRSKLLAMGAEWDSDEVEKIEFLISEIEVLPEFEEVIQMIADGRMKSLW